MKNHDSWLFFLMVGDGRVWIRTIKTTPWTYCGLHRPCHRPLSYSIALLALAPLAGVTSVLCKATMVSGRTTELATLFCSTLLHIFQDIQSTWRVWHIKMLIKQYNDYTGVLWDDHNKRWTLSNNTLSQIGWVLRECAAGMNCLKCGFQEFGGTSNQPHNHLSEMEWKPKPTGTKPVHAIRIWVHPLFVVLVLFLLMSTTIPVAKYGDCSGDDAK